MESSDSDAKIDISLLQETPTDCIEGLTVDTEDSTWKVMWVSELNIDPSVAISEPVGQNSISLTNPQYDNSESHFMDNNHSSSSDEIFLEFIPSHGQWLIFDADQALEMKQNKVSYLQQDSHASNARAMLFQNITDEIQPPTPVSLREQRYSDHDLYFESKDEVRLSKPTETCFNRHFVNKSAACGVDNDSAITFSNTGSEKTNNLFGSNLRKVKTVHTVETEDHQESYFNDYSDGDFNGHVSALKKNINSNTCDVTSLQITDVHGNDDRLKLTFGAKSMFSDKSLRGDGNDEPVAVYQQDYRKDDNFDNESYASLEDADPAMPHLQRMDICKDIVSEDEIPETKPILIEFDDEENTRRKVVSLPVEKINFLENIGLISSDCRCLLEQNKTAKRKITDFSWTMDVPSSCVNLGSPALQKVRRINRGRFKSRRRRASKWKTAAKQRNQNTLQSSSSHSEQSEICGNILPVRSLVNHLPSCSSGRSPHFDRNLPLPPRESSQSYADDGTCFDDHPDQTDTVGEISPVVPSDINSSIVNNVPCSEMKEQFNCQETFVPSEADHKFLVAQSVGESEVVPQTEWGSQNDTESYEEVKPHYQEIASALQDSISNLACKITDNYSTARSSNIQDSNFACQISDDYPGAESPNTQDNNCACQIMDNRSGVDSSNTQDSNFVCQTTDEYSGADSSNGQDNNGTCQIMDSYSGADSSNIQDYNVTCQITDEYSGANSSGTQDNNITCQITDECSGADSSGTQDNNITYQITDEYSGANSSGTQDNNITCQITDEYSGANSSGIQHNNIICQITNIYSAAVPTNIQNRANDTSVSKEGKDLIDSENPHSQASTYDEEAVENNSTLNLLMLQDHRFLKDLKQTDLSGTLRTCFAEWEKSKFTTCSCEILFTEQKVATVKWGRHEFIALRHDFQMVLWMDLIRENIINFQMASHPLLDRKTYPSVWYTLTDRESDLIRSRKGVSAIKDKVLINFVFFVYVMEHFIQTKNTLVSQQMNDRLAMLLKTPIYIIYSGHKKCKQDFVPCDKMVDKTQAQSVLNQNHKNISACPNGGMQMMTADSEQVEQSDTSFETQTYHLANRAESISFPQPPTEPEIFQKESTVIDTKQKFLQKMEMSISGESEAPYFTNESTHFRQLENAIAQLTTTPRSHAFSNNETSMPDTLTSDWSETKQETVCTREDNEFDEITVYTQLQNDRAEVKQIDLLQGNNDLSTKETDMLFSQEPLPLTAEPKTGLSMKYTFVNICGLIYQHCLCTDFSAADRHEKKAWQSVRVGSQLRNLDNLGLLRFMRHNIFTFEHNGSVYISVNELFQRELLPTTPYMRELISEILESVPHSEVVGTSDTEREFLTEFFDKGGDSLSYQLITPCALSFVYRQLSIVDGTYRVHASSLFYRMILGHQCFWSFQVTPPTTQLHQIPGYEHPDGTEQPAAMIVPVTKDFTSLKCKQSATVEQYDDPRRGYYDGGGGTPPRISDHLLMALQNTIQTFDLQDIAEPFCCCDIRATDLARFRPLTLDGVTLYHVTEMTFAGCDKLHCWKRNSGFFVSFEELQVYSLLPCERHPIIAQLLKEHQAHKCSNQYLMDNITHLMEFERVFLKQLTIVSSCKGTCHHYANQKNDENCNAGFTCAPDLETFTSSSQYPIQSKQCTESHKILQNKKNGNTLYFPGQIGARRIKTKERLDLKVRWTDTDDNVICLEAVNAENKQAYDAEDTDIICLEEVEVEEVEGAEHNGDICLGKSEIGRKFNIVKSDDIISLGTVGVTKTAEKDGVMCLDTGEIQGEPHTAESNDVYVNSEKLKSQKNKTNNKQARSTILINLKYLNFMYKTLESSDLRWHAYVSSKFYIKHWDHMCSTESLTKHKESEKYPETEGQCMPTESVQVSATSADSMESEAPPSNDTVLQSKTKTRSDTSPSVIEPNRKEMWVAIEDDDVQILETPIGLSEVDRELHQTNSTNTISASKLAAANLGHYVPAFEKEPSHLLDPNAHQVSPTTRARSAPTALDSRSEDISSKHTQRAENSPLVCNPVKKVIQHMTKKTVQSITCRPEVDKPEDKKGEIKYLFTTVGYPHSCNCPKRIDSFLKSFSVLQCVKSDLALTLAVCDNIQQVIILNCLLFAFQRQHDLFFNLSDLQRAGLIHANCTLMHFKDYGDQLYKMNDREEKFLQELGMLETSALGTSMVSTDTVCHLSHISSIWKQGAISKTDIYLHQVGHICPDPSSLAHRIQSRFIFMPKITKAWMKSFLWQQSNDYVNTTESAEENFHPKTASQATAGSVLNQTTFTHQDRYEIEDPVTKQVGCKESSQDSLTVANTNSGTEYSVLTRSRKAASQMTASIVSQMGAMILVRIVSKTELVTPGYNANKHVSKHLYTSLPSRTLSNSLRQTVSVSFLRSEVHSVRFQPQTLQTPCSWTDLQESLVVEGLMVNDSSQDIQLLQCKADEENLKTSLSNLMDTHHLVLSGVVRSSVIELPCLKFDDKLYLNWGQFAFAVQTLIPPGILYKLARKLCIFVYLAPHFLNGHIFSKHFANYQAVQNSPWVCVNSLYAVYFLASQDKATAQLHPEWLSHLHNILIDKNKHKVTFSTFFLIQRSSIKHLYDIHWYKCL